MNIFELIATMATAIRNLDSRITYAPLHLRDDGSAHLVFACNDDAAVCDLAERFEMPPPRLQIGKSADGSQQRQWLSSTLSNGHLEIQIYGPHVSVVLPTETATQQGA